MKDEGMEEGREGGLLLTFNGPLFRSFLQVDRNLSARLVSVNSHSNLIGYNKLFLCNDFFCKIDSHVKQIVCVDLFLLGGKQPFH